ncbi:MAG: DUF5009 domain-containing protein, partial [Verrucomicrobiota bacterium]
MPEPLPEPDLASGAKLAETEALDNEPVPQKAERLLSLDVLRGFDMFWIIGGTAFLRALAEASGNQSFLDRVMHLTTHVGWDGFVPYDLIFPLFVFMTGVTMPFTLTRRLEQGTPRHQLYGRVFRRLVFLVFLGILPGLLQLNLDTFRPLSVLGLIGVAYFIAGMVVIHRSVRGQVAWIFGLLIGYAVALYTIRLPGVTAGPITPSGFLGGFIDRTLLPGQLYQHAFDPEGTLQCLPAAAIALLGVQGGHWLRASERPEMKNVFRCVAAGGVCLALGYGLGQLMPVVKAIWSSTFILVAGGWSFLLLGLFYFLVDICRLKWLFWVFVPIGMNALTIYVAGSYIDFEHTAQALFGGLSGKVPEIWGPVVVAAGVLIVEWVILYLLYR